MSDGTSQTTTFDEQRKVTSIMAVLVAGTFMVNIVEVVRAIASP